MATMKTNKGLGRGLDVLLMGNTQSNSDSVLNVAVENLQSGKYQPRTLMDEVSLNELAASIKTQGVIQPILVRELTVGSYEIIAGERRWRAAQIAGLTQVPVLIRNVRDADALTMAIIENIQREDLNPMEEAQGIQRLIDEFQMTHQTAADAVGRSRSAASNLLRLLKLPLVIQEMVLQNKLDMGHARALLPMDAATQILFANKIAFENMSVREAEKLVQRHLDTSEKQEKIEKPIAQNRDTLEVEENLASRLGTKVEIKTGRKGAGRLIINYQNNVHLDELISKLCGELASSPQ